MSSKKRKPKTASEKGSNKKSKPDKDEKKAEAPPAYESTTEKKTDSKASDLYYSTVYASLDGEGKHKSFNMHTRVGSSSYEVGLGEFRRTYCELVFLFDDLVTKLEAFRFRHDPNWQSNPEVVRLQVVNLVKARIRSRQLNLNGHLLCLKPDFTMEFLEVPGFINAD